MAQADAQQSNKEISVRKDSVNLKKLLQKIEGSALGFILWNNFTGSLRTPILLLF